MKDHLPEQPQAFDRGEEVKVVERLIDTARDGEQGYADAAEHIKDPELRAYFAEQSRERARFAADLKAELHKLGKWEETRQGSVAGTLQRAWFDVVRVLGSGDRAILQAVEAGEDRARNAYQEALKHELPLDIAGVIRSQAQSVIAAHDHAKAVRDRRTKAA